MNLTYNSEAPKRATNLSINSDLLQKVKSYNINLSKNFEYYLNELVKKEEEKKWREENFEAIASFNERVKEMGILSDKLRKF